MRLPRQLAASAALGLALAAAGQAVTLEVNNPVGAIRVEVVDSPRLHVQGVGTNRKATEADTEIIRSPDRITVNCKPADGEPIDLNVRLPLGFFLQATTKAGSILLHGMMRNSNLETETGPISITAPWRATRLQIDSDKEPAAVSLPPDIKFSRRTINATSKRTIWRLRDRLDERHVTYGAIRVNAASPAAITLANLEIPDDSPVKMPWQAPEVLDAILRGESRKKEARPDQPPPAAEAREDTVSSADFSLDVRMVNLILTAHDARGHPVADLTPGDFEVIENGAPQRVNQAGSDDARFNLAILLDLSGSTKPDRAAMMAAAQRFIGIAGSHDRVALYALAENFFHVIAPLTSGHKALLEAARSLPTVSGASPIYDMIALAYAEELHHRPGERNGLIVISDGIDNQISKQELPSSVRFKNLLKAAGEMNALIYPVFLRSGERFGRNWSLKSRERMQELADASGGRLFPAESISDLDPVFPLVAQELRSVYTVAYYPENQAFDGAWRSVQVKVRRPGVQVRARPGYYAR